MGDIHCAKCGEPWDAHGVQHGDMNTTEAERFLGGDGCPSCNFGKECPQCNGMGKKSDGYDRDECCRNGRILVWSPNKSNYTYSCMKWYSGYAPRVRTMPDDIDILGNIRSFMTNEGRVREAWARCPTCQGNGEHLKECARCKGTGKLGKPTLEQESKFMGEALEETDEPDALLETWSQ